MEKAQETAGLPTGDPLWIVDADVPGKFRLNGKGTTNKNLKVVYIKDIPFTTNGSSVALRGSESGISAIVFYALSVLWRREGKNRNPERAALYEGLFEREVSKRQNRSVLAKRHSIWPGGKYTDTIKADYGNDL
jgi:hypothetical protein